MEGDPSVIIVTAGLILSFFLSAIFSIVKVIFKSIDVSSIPADDEYLRYSASRVEHLLENEPLLKSTVSLGRTFANTSFAILAFISCSYYFPYLPLYQKVVFPLLFSFLTLSLFAYDIPRAFAMQYYRGLFAVTFSCYKIFGWFFLPVATLFLAVHNGLLKMFNYDKRFAFLSDDEKARIKENHEGTSLDEEEKEMIRSIFDLSETTVEEIMVPRIDITGLDLHSPFKEVLKMVRDEGHSRIPVYKENVDSVVGILYAKDILSWISEHEQDEWNLEHLIKKPLYIPMGKKVNDLMRDFKLKHMHLAIVVDEYGGTAGLVTMEDILEEIVGDIQDEYDAEEMEVVKVEENVYLVDPHIDLYDLNDELNINLELDDADYNTLSGLIYHEYGDIPQENATFDYDCLHLTIVKMDNQRIEKVKVEVIHRARSVEESTF